MPREALGPCAGVEGCRAPHPHAPIYQESLRRGLGSGVVIAACLGGMLGAHCAFQRLAPSCTAVCKEGVVVDKNCDKCLPGFGGYYCDRCAPNQVRAAKRGASNPRNVAGPAKGCRRQARGLRRPSADPPPPPGPLKTMQVAPGGGVDECATCPNGTVPNPTKSKCVKICGPGEGGLPDESDCVICPRGSFSAGGDVTLPQPACQACPVGVSTDRNGSTSDAECTRERPRPERTEFACKGARIGAACAGLASPAQLGYQGVGSGLRMVGRPPTRSPHTAHARIRRPNIPCPAGVAVTLCNPGRGGPQCSPCERGAFSAGGTPADPKAACRLCFNQKTTAGEGSQNATECSVQICTAGTGGTSCDPCAVGYWSAGGTLEDPMAPCARCDGLFTTNVTKGAPSPDFCKGAPRWCGAPRAARYGPGMRTRGGRPRAPARARAAAQRAARRSSRPWPQPASFR